MRQALRTSNTSQAQRREEILMRGTAVWHGGVRTSSSWTPFFFVDGRNILWVTVLGKFITLPGPTPIDGVKVFGSGQNLTNQASSELVQDVLSQSVTVGIRTGGRALILLVCPCTKCW